MRLPRFQWIRGVGLIVGFRYAFPTCEREDLGYRCHEYLPEGCECSRGAS